MMWSDELGEMLFDEVCRDFFGLIFQLRFKVREGVDFVKSWEQEEEGGGKGEGV